MNYYLPTTLKLLNAYDRMSSQGVEGQNISGTMERVESMMSTSFTALNGSWTVSLGISAGYLHGYHGAGEHDGP